MRLTLLLLLCTFSGFAQIEYRTTPFKIKKINTFEPRNAVPDKYDARVFSLEAPSPSGDSYKDFLFRQKEQISKDFPRNGLLKDKASRAEAAKPIIVDTFGVFWNGPNGKTLVNGGNPNDNSTAFSDNFLIASWNSRIFFWDLKADTPLVNPPLGYTHIGFQDFAGNIGLRGSFDPKILFDPNLNRFVLMFLDVDRADRFNTTKTIIGFSSTENPLDPWNVYEIDGNPMKNNTWSDYPQIAFSDKELFYSVNLLTGGDWVGDFQRTIVWQIDKNSGFNGDSTLNTVLWDSIYHNGQALRYFHTVGYGTEDMGDEMYFISNRAIPVNPDDTISYSYDSLFVAKIDNTISSGSAKLTVQKGKANTRTHTSPLAEQATGGKRFWTNDSRILGAFNYDGKIQFVGNSIDTTNGNSGVYHGFVDNIDGPLNVKVNIISHDTLDLGFPNIAYVGYGNGDQDALLGFNHSSPYDFAGFSTIYYDGNGNYSPITRVVEGNNYVVTNSYPTSERWGDYFGIQRNYTEQHSVWMLGYHGNTNRTSGMYLAKIKGPKNLAGVSENKEKKEATVFPNPSVGRINVDFEVDKSSYITIELLNLSGQVIDKLLSTSVKSGRNQLSFETYAIPSGTYLLNIKSSGELITTKRIVIQ
ncbi:MAG: T9SS type A sorting domain-containing protein [Salibacteraceae bacterium]